jgi:hypothetical protein
MNDVLSPGIGHNRPPESVYDVDALESAKAEAERIAKTTTEWAEAHPVIKAENVASVANDYLKQISDHHKVVDAARAAAKAIHDRRAAEVQAAYRPVLNDLELCAKVIRGLHNNWLKSETDRLAAERLAKEAEAREAQRRADQLAEQAQAGGRSVVANMMEAQKAADKAEEARKAAAAVPQRAQTRGALGGRTRSLVTHWYAKIMDQDRLYRHFRDHEAVTAVLQRLADAAARSGVRNPALPGCWIDSEMR